MAGRVVNCPNCGGQVEFRAGTSLLSVCGFCSSAVARVGDDIGELEILGKVAPLAEIGSPLAIGVQGQLHRKDFLIVGRMQLNHGAGPWNEWYLAFDDGRWAWLSESQGRVHVTFLSDIDSFAAENPDTGPEQFALGARFTVGGQSFVVKEDRTAKFISAEGELPFAVPLDSEFAYCDFEGPRGTFGTLDFGDAQDVESVFVGREHEYKDLFDKDIVDNRQNAEALAGVAMNCPNCGSAVEVQAPGESQRVSCGACESLLDCSKGNELYLLKAAEHKGPDPKIPLGSIAKHDGEKWTAYGFLIRSVTYEGTRYPWEEYLMRSDAGAFRWLSCSDGHWTFGEPASVAEIDLLPRNRAKYKSQVYRHYQTGEARVDSLRGEFYWKVKVGAVSSTMDYIAPPRMLSCERSGEDGSEEINWSIGTYKTTEEMTEMFGGEIEFASPSRQAAPHQSNPHIATKKTVTKMALAFTALVLGLAFLLSSMKSGAVIFETAEELKWYVPTDKDAAVATTILTEPFELPRATNLEIRLSSNVKNNWMALQGALINEAKGEVRYFSLDNSYYFGTSGGYGWSEGTQKKSLMIGSIPAGSYRLSLKPAMSKTKNQNAVSYKVRVRSNIFYRGRFIVCIFLLWIFPWFIRSRCNRFERKRWSQSDYG